MKLDDLRGRATCTIEEAAAVLNLKRSTAYDATRPLRNDDGTVKRPAQLPTIRIGRRKFVAVPALLAMLGDDPERDPSPLTRRGPRTT
jgi:predicted transcriptional regulator